MLIPLLFALLAVTPYQDRTFQSRVFGQERHCRLFLPAGYEKGTDRYPVIYYFHGHSDRYTLERDDDGKDTVPKIARSVATHPVIVVSVDGYVAEHYTGFYGGAPYTVMQDGGKYEFGEYFKELVAHIDSTLRTVADRRHRATSGLSMGGSASLDLSARYPDPVGSASAFNPGPEFYAGEAGRRVLWRAQDHVPNHSHSMIRLIRASGDYISQYHEQTRRAYSRGETAGFEFRQDEYHRHWATSIGETFEFHARAFDTPALSNIPEVFRHDHAHAKFSVWGWDFATRGGGAGFTQLRGVSQTGLRVETRKWAPDGPAVSGGVVSVTTAPLYQAGSKYTVMDAPLNGGAAKRVEVAAVADGRLKFDVDGPGRQVSITGPGAGAHQPVLLPVSRDVLRVMPGREVALTVRIYNPRTEAMKGVSIELESDYPIVELLGNSATVAEIPAGGSVDLSKQFRAKFTAGAGDCAPARIKLSMSAGWPGTSDQFDVMITPEGLTAPLAMEVLDGRTVKFTQFRQKGNQGGGSTVERTVTEGKGNGNGVLEPGEEATVRVKLAQGLDPFDKGTWHRARVFSDSPWIEETGRFEEQKQREWTSARELTSVVRLSPQTPAATEIPIVLSNESWSFHFTPDVRYGTEPLYQAYQFHRNHVFSWTPKVRAKE